MKEGLLERGDTHEPRPAQSMFMICPPWKIMDPKIGERCEPQVKSLSYWEPVGASDRTRDRDRASRRSTR